MDKIIYWPAADATRGALLAFCMAADSNGCWTDAQCEIEGMEPATREDLLAIIAAWRADCGTVQS